jgi:predicted restriction endonuclease
MGMGVIRFHQSELIMIGEDAKVGNGRPHDGLYDLGNLLCLRPNHHLLFDNGTFDTADALNLTGLQEGKRLFEDIALMRSF